MQRLFENFENVTTPEECSLRVNVLRAKLYISIDTAYLLKTVRHPGRFVLMSVTTSGTVPTWLQGTMVRNGPGMFKIGDTEYKHWFDGMAYIQRYHFEDAKMFYSARYLEGDDYNECMRANRIITGSFGTVALPDPCKTIFQRFALPSIRMVSYFTSDIRLSDRCSVAFIANGDAVYALTESPYMVRIDLDNLDRIEKVDFRGHLKLNLHTNTAHFHSDHDGNVYNIGTILGHCYAFTKTTNPLHVEGTMASASFENSRRTHSRT
ncbi:unnamed protein product [Heligmosomoides polygyrus]|uniref:DUF4915 domain-containing protein n=1 Tax=Heligmosomoides polygyrus TaxID=6339 RepID=A0A3P7U2V6_HELPZ|nr:unnamed protein product [Heligmosomoides polygyrus]